MTQSLGRHILLEFFGCAPETLSRVNYVENALLNSAEVSNAKVVDTLFHQFLPYGVSGVVVIEESHFTIHTWPEHGYAAVDIFTCSNDVDVENAVAYLRGAFQPENVERKEVDRGATFKLETV